MKPRSYFLVGQLLVCALLLIAPAIHAATPNFSPKTDYSTAINPTSVTGADFNGDGKIDLAVANNGFSDFNFVSVFLNKGNGVFTKIDYPANGYSTSLTVGDFNNDGKNDMAITSKSNSGSVSVFLNNGNGTFAAKVDYPTGTNPQSVIAGDFNSDGQTDLAVAIYGTSSVSVFLNNGNGIFASKADYATGANPTSVIIGDFNSDGKTDLATANTGTGTNTVSVLLGDGNGFFAAKSDYPTGSAPSSLTRGDFNSDGQTDLAVANQGGTVSVLLNNGSGGFAAKIDYSTGSRPFSITRGDFNGDGKSDLATANYSGNNVSVLLGNGNGTFAAKSDFATGNNAFSLTSNDFNGDGKSDLAVANYGSNTVSLLLSAVSGGQGASLNFAAKVDTPVGTNAISIARGDFNGDGKTDLATANVNSNNVSVLLGSGNGTTFSKTTVAVETSPQSITTGDFNGDGKTDLATANSDSQSVSILLNGGSGTTFSKTGVSFGNAPFDVTSGDFNGDGKTDLATVNNGIVRVSLNSGSGTGSAFTQTDVFLSSRAIAVTVGDFNGDGKTDLATANLQNSVSVLLGSGNGTTFSTATTFLGVNPQSVTTGDFNGDGKTDLATGNYGSNTVTVLINDGDGINFYRTNFAVGTQPLRVTSGDFDGDGKTDLAAANSGGTTVSVLLNGGNGTNFFRTDLPTSPNPQSVVSGDFNGDGKTDLATANYGNTVSVLLNGGASVPVSANIGNVTQNEGNSGPTNFVFTITLSAASTSDVTLNYTIGGASATAETDFGAAFDSDGGTPGVLTIAANATSGTITVPVNGDTTYEANESFSVTLSNPTGAALGTSSVGTGTIQNDDAPSSSSVIISEFRLSGPGGESDEFIELSNTSASSVDLTGYTLTFSDGVQLSSVLSGKSIPAGGHLLLANSDGYSLSSVARGDAFYTGNIASNASLTLKDAGGNVVDFAGNLSVQPSSSTNQYSFVRRLESGVPAKTGNDTNDFNLVDTSATVSTSGATGVGPLTAPRLGAPGPQNTLSPIQRNDKIGFVPINAATVGTPAEGRYASKGSALDSPNGRQTLRRTVTNNSGQTVTKMRFRIVAMTGGTSTASGVADLRALTSAGVTVGGTKIVNGITLDAPSSPTVAPSGFGNNPASSGNGGGLNSSWTVDLSQTSSLLLSDGSSAAGGIPAGKSLNVEFLFAIVQNGSYRVVVDTELVP